MPANSNTLALTIDVDDKGTMKVRNFAGEMDKAAKQSAQGAGAVDGMAASTGRLTGSVRGLGVALGVTLGAAAIGTLVRGALELARAADEIDAAHKRFNATFQGQQQTATAAVAMLEKYYSMNRTEAEESLAGVQTLMTNMGMAAGKASAFSLEVAKLSADLGNFNRIPTAQTLHDVEMALSGSYEGLRKYGIVINEQTVRQQALQLGLAKTKDELTSGEKAYAAFTLMVEKSSNAISESQTDNYAKQLKQYEDRWKSFNETLGTFFLPIANSVVTKLNEIAEAQRKAWFPTKDELNPYRLYEQKLTNELAYNERQLAAWEKTNFYDPLYKQGKMEALKQEIALQKDKLAILRAQLAAEGKSPLGSAPGEINIPGVTKSDFTPNTGPTAAEKKALADAKALENEIRKAQEQFELAKMGQSRLEEFTAGGQDQNALARMEYERQQTIIAEQNKSWLAQAESDRTNLAARMAEYEKTYKGILDLTERTAEAMQENFSNLFFDAMTGKLKTLEDYANAIFESIARMASDLMAQQVTRSLFGSNMQGGGLLTKLYDAMFGYDINAPTAANKALPFHSGGLVGNSGGDPRMLPAWMIAMAPRLHNGLAPDEYPAVLQYGERVQSRREVAAERMAASESKVQVIVNNNSREQATVSESRGPDGTRQIEIMIGNMLVNGGPATQALKNGFGLRRLGR